ncbi:MAG: hypothetical protein ABJH98_12260 [Reichenbachiella sp.]
MKYLNLLVALLTSFFSYAQTGIVEELYGFRLGQYRAVTTNELGDPASTIYLEDSSRVDFFYLNEDSSTHVGFIYMNSSDEINSIQLTGNRISRDFGGLNLGASPTEAIALFGEPDDIENMEFNDDSVATYFYQDKNYSFVFNGNMLSSIKIWDPLVSPDYESEDYELPTLEPLVRNLSRSDLDLNFLSPVLEITYCDEILMWKKSVRTEIENPDKSFLEFIFNEQYGLVTLAKYDSIPAEMNLRLIQGLGSLPVYKFNSETLFEEIVFLFQQGRYKIWEIKYKCEE